MPKFEKIFAVGIDLGTTNSLIAVERSGNMQVVANEDGSRITASAVRLGSSRRVIGNLAHRSIQNYPKETVHSVKRIIGRSFSDPCVQAFKAYVDFKIVNVDDKPAVSIQLTDKTELYTPEQVSAMILGSLKSSAEQYVEKTVKKAVITVPAAFNETQRRATKEAGMIAGFEVLAIINEPTAAALQWIHENEHTGQEKVILVFDMGGGTTDISIVSVGEKDIRVISTIGDTELGGCDIDKMLEVHFVKQVMEENGCDLSKSPKSVAELRKVCVALKHQLSSKMNVSASIDNLLINKTFKLSLSRFQFEKIIDPIRERVLELLRKALKMDGDGAGDEVVKISDIVLVGGSSRMPWIKALFEEWIGEGKIVHKNLNCDEVVAEGAGIYASFLMGSSIFPDIHILDIAPLTYGIEVDGGIMAPIIKQGATLPASHTRHFTTAEDNQRSIQFQIYEGSSDRVSGCRKLGELKIFLNKYEGSKKGAPSIELTFSLSRDFLLEATAREVTGGLTVKCRVNVLRSHDLEKIEELKRIEEDLRNLDEREDKRIELFGKLERMAYERRSSKMIAWIRSNRTATVERIKEKLNEFEQV